MASSSLTSGCIHVADGVHAHYKEILAVENVVGWDGEPHLDICFTYVAKCRLLPWTKVTSRRRFEDYMLGFNQDIIREHEYLPMEIMVDLLDPEEAERVRWNICNVIYFLLHRCRQRSGVPLKCLQVIITVEIWRRKLEDTFSEFICKRRMSRVLCYVYGGGGDCKEENCSICLDEMKEGEKVACVPCTHRFHVKCLRSWFMKAGFCPLCRFEIDG